MKTVCPNRKAVLTGMALKDKKREKQDPTAFDPFLRLINDTGEGVF